LFEKRKIMGSPFGFIYAYYFTGQPVYYQQILYCVAFLFA
jgi:hypothetical protein